MVSYFNYVRSLSFTATPDYEYLYDLLYGILEDKRLHCDWEFDWLTRRAVNYFMNKDFLRDFNFYFPKYMSSLRLMTFVNN